jgi:hypothetical protein
VTANGKCRLGLSPVARIASRSVCDRGYATAHLPTLRSRSVAAVQHHLAGDSVGFGNLTVGGVWTMTTAKVGLCAAASSWLGNGWLTVAWYLLCFAGLAFAWPRILTGRRIITQRRRL